MLPQRIADPFVRNVIGKYIGSDAVAMPDRPRTSFVVIHHAAFEYEPGKAVESIFNYHKVRFPKYSRIGYHEVVQVETDGSLRCYRVNPPDMQGAGVANRNHECYHICAATNFGSSIPEQLWIDALALRAVDAKRRYSEAKIVGHREIALPVSPTACPGTRWAAWKPTLLTQVASILAQQTVVRYRVRVPSYWLEDRRADAPIANQGRALLQAGDLIAIDDVKDGWAHAANGIGFTPIAALEKVS